jgi:uncharacterized membrane protein
MTNLLRTIFRKYILTGVLVMLPLFLTGWVVLTLVKWTDRALALIPPAYRPENLIGFPIPGLGLILSIAIVFVIGALVANVMGRRLLATGEAILEKVPVLRWFYFSSKQVLEAIFIKGEDSFRRAILLEYPRKGIYSIGFITGETSGQIDRAISGKLYNVFVPTTPNPTSGYLIVVPAADTIALDWTVDEAFRFIVSAGVLAPEDLDDNAQLLKQPPPDPSPDDFPEESAS